ncbi:hypothetical protein MGU_06246 [Metarhizium guizhouense ARSEF 977]|uniref:Uncharacterized protein n=1 Tax=Metarhizium guizhouense (strain ARSEF 977) TaxID=1276136 RepID=A0A0B4I2N1_METGA|nr:hypothetical protein MGU_06246 [Metarhizium guizhouense ARSEF 977]
MVAQSQVKKIIKVTVIDYGGQCHSDPAIEEALRGFDVEVWDWKKVDLCSDVIFDCVGSVREISLYSSGNGAAVMGWSDPQVFRNSKFPNVWPGPKALEEYVLAFIDGLQSEHQTFFRAKDAGQQASEGQSLIQHPKTTSLYQRSITKKE